MPHETTYSPEIEIGYVRAFYRGVVMHFQSFFEIFGFDDVFVFPRDLNVPSVGSVDDFYGSKSAIVFEKSFLACLGTVDREKKTLVIVFLFDFNLLFPIRHGENVDDNRQKYDEQEHTYLNKRKFIRVRMYIIDVSGLIGSVVIVIMFIPEVIHVYKYKDAKAINYSFLHLNLIASVLSLVYSIYYDVVPMTITNVSAGLFSLLMYYFKYVYELKEEIPITTIEDAPIV